MNKVILMGRLTRDAEVRYSPTSGQSPPQFSNNITIFSNIL